MSNLLREKNDTETNLKRFSPPFKVLFPLLTSFPEHISYVLEKGPASFSIQLRKLRPRRLAKCHRSPHAYIHVKMAKTKNGSKSCLQYLLRVKDLKFCNSRPPSNKRPSATLLREFKDGPTTMMQLKCIIGNLTSIAKCQMPLKFDWQITS